MPLRTFERWQENGTPVRETRGGRGSFLLPPSQAARILGTTPEAVKRAMAGNPNQSFDSMLLALAIDMTLGRIYGWVEPGTRSLTEHPTTGNAIYAFRAADNSAYRKMVLAVPLNNQPPA
ncbi:hypothetical protein HYW44_01220 [Candidatus Daviesbacteria bacterium]|nr:hypothetical protein [Candidatus Daviesbacteria bacterium]